METETLTASSETLDPITSVDLALMNEWSQSEFRLWCGRLFNRFGYVVSLDDPDCDVRLVRDGEQTLVECIAEPGDSAGDNQVTRAQCQRLIGAMVGNQITRGIVITTGTFSEDCEEYAILLDGLTLDLIDGTEMAKSIEALQSGPLLKWLMK